MRQFKTYDCTHCGNSARFKYSKLNLYCSQKCQNEYQTKERVRQWLEEGKDWKFGVPHWVKGKTGELAKRFGYKCQICSVKNWENKELILECDHIDGNHTNNIISNLRLICPNCHSQTKTYKNRNLGNGRKNRRKRA